MKLNQIFKDIADAIRSKGVTGKMKPVEMASKIMEISNNPSFIPEDDEWQKPDDWPDIKKILEENRKPEYPYAYAMLVLGKHGDQALQYINVPAKGNAFQWWKTSWGIDEQANKSQKLVLDGENDYEWIIVYSNTNQIDVWNPKYSTYDYRWLVWFYGPDMTITAANSNSHGFYGITSIKRIEIDQMKSFSKAFQCGTYFDNVSIKCNKWEIDQSTSISWVNGRAVPLNEYINIPIDVSKARDLHDIFNSCFYLRRILNDCSDWNTSNVNNMWGSFNGCTTLEKIDTHNWNLENCTRADNMFLNCRMLKEIDTTNFGTLNNCTQLASMFSGCINLKNLDISRFELHNAISTASMFYYCSSLKSVDCHNMRLDKATAVNSMFAYCSLLESIDCRNMITSAVTNLANLFDYCRALKTINLSNWDTRNATTFNSMFRYCSSLEDLDLSMLNSDNVTNIAGMVNGCSNLRSLNMTNWNTSKVTNFSNTFDGCKSLKRIYGTIDMTSATSVANIFQACYSLQSIPNIINCKLSISFLALQQLSDKDSVAKFDPDGNIIGGIVYNLVKPTTAQTISFYTNTKTLFTASEWTSIKSYLSSKNWNISPA